MFVVSMLDWLIATWSIHWRVQGRTCKIRALPCTEETRFALGRHNRHYEPENNMLIPFVGVYQGS